MTDLAIQFTGAQVQHGSSLTENSLSERRTASAGTGTDPVDSTDAIAIFSAVCARLRYVRQSQGLSLAEAASRFRLSQTVLSRLERAKRDPRLHSLISISSALGVRLSDILRIAEDEAFPLGLAPWTACRTPASHEGAPVDQMYHGPVGSD